MAKSPVRARLRFWARVVWRFVSGAPLTCVMPRAAQADRGCFACQLDRPSKPDDDLIDRDEAEYWKQMKAFDRTYWNVALINGSFPICHQGCALRILLVVSGDQAGYLWDDRRSEYGGIKPIRLADGSPATFSGWYREWLDRCLYSSKSAQS